MNPIKVLHLNSERTWRGGEKQISILLEELTKNYIDINFIVVCRLNSPLYHYCIKKKYTTIGLKFRNELDLFSAYQLKKICKNYHIDIIHIHAARAHAIAFLSYLLFKNRVKVILSRRVDYHIKNNFFSIAKYNYPSIKKVLCVSYEVKKIISNSLKNSKICEVVFDGIDCNLSIDIRKTLYEEFNLPPETIIIGNTSALTEQKDYPTFLKAAVLILKEIPNARFFILGDGFLRSSLEKMTVDLLIDKYVFFLGFREDVLEILSQFHLFLFTSQFEGFGSSLLNAYSLKVPIVASNVGGIPEVVEHNKTGFLASVHNSEEFSKYAIKIIMDSKLKNRFINAGLIKVKQFSKENMILKTVYTYREINNIIT